MNAFLPPGFEGFDMGDYSPEDKVTASLRAVEDLLGEMSETISPERVFRDAADKLPVYFFRRSRSWYYYMVGVKTAELALLRGERIKSQLKGRSLIGADTPRLHDLTLFAGYDNTFAELPGVAEVGGYDDYQQSLAHAQRLADLIHSQPGNLRVKVWAKPGAGARVYLPRNQYISISRGGDASYQSRG